jgi:hypothetical protein
MDTPCCLQTGHNRAELSLGHVRTHRGTDIDAHKSTNALLRL